MRGNCESGAANPEQLGSGAKVGEPQTQSAGWRGGGEVGRIEKVMVKDENSLRLLIDSHPQELPGYSAGELDTLPVGTGTAGWLWDPTGRLWGSPG